MRRLGFLLAAPALLVLTCGPAPSPPARAYDVQVDARAAPFSIAVNAYFPQNMQAHPGDTIRFTAVDRGEIHTVTLGTQVDKALAASLDLPRERRPSLDAFNLPPLVVGKPASLAQAAAQPCFLENGVPQPSVACAKDQQRQPQFTGTQTFFNSGYLPGGAVFAVKLSEGIKPGAYGYLCLLHGADMTGRIVVVEKARAVPTPEEVKAHGADELGAVVRALKGSYDNSRTKGVPVAGVFAPEYVNAQVTEFVPAEIAVGVGDSVTWTVFGLHTISFNVPQNAIGTLLPKEADGSWTLNAKALDPANSPEPPPASAAPLVIDSGVWDGRGFRSSGLLNVPLPGSVVSTAPAVVSYKVTITQPGTYVFKCLVHIDLMEGTLKVGR